MATVPASRPDLAAHREALRLPIPEIVKQLIGLIGRKLTAYVGGVRDVRAVDRWMSGSELYGDAEQRLTVCLPAGPDALRERRSQQ